MRRTILALVTGIAVLAAHSAPASEREASRSDISAAKKKKQRHLHVGGAASVAARRGWFDPSLGPDGKPYRSPYPPGTCSIDQGYGRFTTCDFHE